MESSMHIFHREVQVCTHSWPTFFILYCIVGDSHSNVLPSRNLTQVKLGLLDSIMLI